MKNNTDKLNTFLIVFALFLAYILPFKLFLISYAILGPLHYITEINWIRDKQYFIQTKNWVVICLIFCCIIALPHWFNFFNINNLNSKLSNSISFLQNKSNSLIFICFFLPIILLYIKNKRKIFIAITLLVIVSFLLVNLSSFNLWVGILVPTVIHVYLFTLLFMWYGSVKSNSKIGFFNVVLLAIIPFLIAFFPLPTKLYSVPLSYVVETYTVSKFYILNTEISKLLNLSDGSSFNFSNSLTTKIQLFISFAYTYHYFNWFSKTTVIGWHKNINKQKTIAFLVLWLLSVSLYVINYKLGLIVLFFLSYAHVFLEFPINFLSIKELISFYTKKYF